MKKVFAWIMALIPLKFVKVTNENNDMTNKQFARRIGEICKTLGTPGMVIGNRHGAVIIQADGWLLIWINKIEYSFRRMYLNYRQYRSILRVFDQDYMRPLAMKSIRCGAEDSIDRVVWVITSLDEDQLDEKIREDYTDTCQHEYSPCGGWYKHPWSHHTKKFGIFGTFRIHYYRNV